MRPIFEETGEAALSPAAAPAELAQAIVDCVDAGARILNISAAAPKPSFGERALQDAVDYAARRHALIVAAAGNQGRLATSAITRHPWVMPVIAYHPDGRPMRISNLAASVGRRGLGAPGEAIQSLGARGGLISGSGTSHAAALVTGAIALLWSLFPGASAADVRQAVCNRGRRSAVAAPLLDARTAYANLSRIARPSKAAA